MSTNRITNSHLSHTFSAIIATAIVAIVSCFAASCGSNAGKAKDVNTADTIMKSHIAALITDSVRDSIGLYVYDITAGREVFSHRSRELMSTASNMKLLTVLTLVKQVGVQHKFTSRLLYKGSIQHETLDGDLYMQFGLDPSFSTDSLARWATIIRQSGIKRIKGRIIMEMPSSYLPMEEHWEALDFRYDLVSPIFRGPDQMAKLIIKAFNSQRLYFNKYNIHWGKVPQQAIAFYTSTSSIEASIFNTLQHSSNIDAEPLLYTLCSDSVKNNNYRKEGVGRIRSFIKNEIQMNPDSIGTIHDGCGLCPEDKLSAYFLVQLLKYAYTHKEIYTLLQKNLPVSGKTGTLRHRMIGTPAEGRIQAKTGRLSRNGGVVSLSGYANASNGHVLIFSCLCNGLDLEKAKAWEDELCQVLVGDFP